MTSSTEPNIQPPLLIFTFKNVHSGMGEYCGTAEERGEEGEEQGCQDLPNCGDKRGKDSWVWGEGRDWGRRGRHRERERERGREKQSTYAGHRRLIQSLSSDNTGSLGAERSTSHVCDCSREATIPFFHKEKYGIYLKYSKAY